MSKCLPGRVSETKWTVSDTKWIVRDAKWTVSENNYFTEMCSGSEAGSYLRLTDFVYHLTLGLKVIKQKKPRRTLGGVYHPLPRSGANTTHPSL